MNEESLAAANGATRSASSPINNDSNSLEAGEIVDDTPPVVRPPEEEVPGGEAPAPGNQVEPGEKTPTAAMTSSSEKSGSSSKPVLGKEKAKQRLKAIGIQKRIQMESKQSRPEKVSRKKSREKNPGGSGSKKDKPPTPHEKAKLTKEEIEKLKEKQDCALPCLYYDAAMIHHIRADFPEKSAPSAGSSKTGPCLTASLEAIKNYEDQDEVPEDSGNPKNNLKLDPQGVETLPGNEHHGQHHHHRVAGPCGEIMRNYNLARRKLNFRGSGDIQHHNFSMRGRYKIIRNRFNPHLRNIQKFRDPNRRLQRELPRLPQILSEGGNMYTKTKPVVTFSINTNINKASSSIIEHKKTRKKSKHKSSINKIKPKKKSRSKSRRDDSKMRSVSSVKSKKKKKIGSKKDKNDKKDRNKKRSKNKKNHPTKVCGALSFHLNEFLPEEDVEVFPLSKDSIEPIEEQDEDDAALENKLKCLQEELNKKSPSPDTDDYMANWEEEEDFAAASVSIDSTPKKLAILAAKVQEQAGADAVRETTPEGSNTPKMGPLPGGSSTSEKINQDQFEPEVRDGLGTPIYVNPSPPAEMFGATPGSEEDTTPPVPPSTRKQIEKEEDLDDFEVAKSSEMTPKIPSSPLFGMQVIYEQFIQSVSEAGIELSLSSQPAPKKSPKSIEVSPQNTTDEEECSFTPNASPTGGKIRENLEDDLPKKVSSSSPKSRSSTPTDSSSDTASSTSSTTTTETSSDSPNGEKNPNLLALSSEVVKDSENVKNVEKSNLPSILSPEDTQKLRSLHERSRMLKNLQEQSDAMDEEDKQCLLGLEKLIEAEKNLLMRKYDVARDLNEELKFRDPPSPCDSSETPEGVTPPRISVKNLTDPINELEANKIFDVNREAVKLKFSPKTQKSASKSVSQAPLDEDDQDFTEKLLKTVAPTAPKDHSVGGERKKRGRKFSRSVSRSPEGQKSIRKGRSLSISPTRRSREQWGEKQKRSKRQRHYSPTPSSRKRAGGGEDSKKGGRSHRWPVSPLIRKRSRSPYGRRFSRSPPFRPPSPKSPPPRGRSMSPQKDRNSRLESDSGPSSALNYSWSEDSAGNYYPTNEGYYYIPSPVQGAVQKPRPTCEPGEFYHPNYRLYNYDYQTMGLYANSYGNEYVGPEPMSSYSRIPVINSAGGNYYYDDFNAVDDSHNPETSEQPETNNNHSNIKQLPIDEGSGTGSTADKKHFVVQKGNVLEIVPTSIIPKIELPDSNSYENETIQIEPSAVVIKSEPEFHQNTEDPLTDTGNDRKIEMPIALKVEKCGTEKKKKKRKNQDFVLWEDEIAKRHILSAVLRLNKEDDGTLRGILYNKPITEKSREKKRVIFADGIPPGRSSSTSDEESSPVRLRIPRRLKKRRRHRKGEENKENEASLGIDTALIGDCFKVDPELENLPPPPPPPGDPPAHLPQPVLLKPPSPEQFLYFHFDPVVSSMYISNSPTPMPPRLLSRGVQSNVAPQMGPPSGAPRNSNSINSNNIPVGGNGSSQPIQIGAATAKGCFIPREQGNEPQICPSPKLGELQHPSVIVAPLQHPERRFRPQQQPFMPPMMMAVAVAGGGEFRPPSPITPGFSMYNRPLLRASPGNLNRSDFPVPPPSPQPSQQSQQILGHPSIPFGPRPPGGVANFNRNIPPPFIGSQQRGESPSMMSNFQPIQPIQQNLGGIRPSGSVQIFTPNVGSIPGFGTPTVGLRPPGAMSSPIVGFSNSNFTPPTSPANVKNIPILLGKSSGIPPPGGQFSRSNTPMMGGGGDNFIPNSQPILPPHPGPRSGPFNVTGMPVQMHRPNLGFPRSFGPPPPPSPQMQQQMFLQQQQQQQSGGAPPQPTVRSMFPSPAGNYPFSRSDGVIPDNQQSPQHPPHPGMST